MIVVVSKGLYNQHMNNAVLLQNCHGNSEYIHLLEMVFARHARYCRYWGFDYRFEYGDIIDPKPVGGDWGKVKMIERALEDYEYVVWLDSDAFIWNVVVDLRAACIRPANVVLYNNPFLLPAVGAMYWHSGPEAKEMIKDWYTTMPGEPNWWEQGEFQNLCAGKWQDRKLVGYLPPEFNYDDYIFPHDQGTSPFVVGLHGYPDVVTRMEHFKRWIDAWTLPSRIGVTLPPLPVAVMENVKTGIAYDDTIR
jgi:hypothetical protein